MAHDAPSQEFIYDQVKATILSGEPGKTERIELQALADRFRVSVTPIREVLFRLMGRGSSSLMTLADSSLTYLAPSNFNISMRGTGTICSRPLICFPTR